MLNSNSDVYIGGACSLKLIFLAWCMSEKKLLDVLHPTAHVPIDLTRGVFTNMEP